MPSPLSCPHCGRPGTITATDRGARIACAHCGTVSQIQLETSREELPVVPTYQGRGETLKVECPFCGERLRLAADLAGKRVMCLCGRAMRLATTAITAPVASPRKPRDPAPKREKRFEADAAIQGMLNEIDDEERPPEQPIDPFHDEPAATPSPDRPRAYQEDGEAWKWWYYIVAGVLIAGFSVWQLLEGEPWIRFGGRRNGPVGGLILAALAIAVGLFSRPRRG